ncbi:MAG: SBBP repeat-containing protein [Candidatus Fimenecus sp.]
MNGNKKIILLSLLLLVAVFAALSACKGDKSGGGETVVVTDENGVPITDENGEAMTVILETTVVEVTNANGEKVYDENGNVKTSVVYIPQEVGVPVTDENGVPVTDKNGEVLTTMIVVPPTTGGPAVTEIPVTDQNGNPITDENGETLTQTITYTTNPATPGGNNANWGATFGGTGNDNFVGTAATADGGFVALMQSNSKDGSMSALAGNSATPIPVLIKYKKNGTVAWQKAISSDRGIIVTGIAVDKDGNIAVCGYTKSSNLGFTNAGDFDAVVFKFNDRGDLQWTQSFGGSLTDGFEAIAASPDGGFAVVGYSSSSDGTGASLGLSGQNSASVLVKYNADGSLAFMKAVGSTGDSLTGVDVDAGGNIYAVGSFSSGALFQSYGKADACVLKYSPSGERLWFAQYGGSDIDNFSAVAASGDGGCVIAGRSKSTDHSLDRLYNQGGYDAILVKFDANGAMAWERNFCGFFDDAFTDIVATADGFAAVGYSNSANRDLRAVGNRGGSDGFVITLNNSGKITSVQGYGGSREDKFNSLCVTTEGKIIACGSTLSSDGDLVGSAAVSDGEKTVGMIARFS